MLRESLLRLLFSRAPRAKAGALCIAREGGWAECARLAHSWGVLPRLRERLEALAIGVPAAVDGEITRLVWDGYVRSAREAESGLRVLGALGAAGVRAAGFKGLSSMARLYPDVKGRVMVDVDVLIAERDLARTAAVLGELGFAPEVECELADYVQFTRNAPGFGGNEEMSFRNQRGNTIDLHWRLGAGFDVDEILRGAEPVTLLGKEFLAVSAVYAVLLCVHHSLRNHFSPDKIMRDLQDLERWRGVWDWDTVRAGAAARGLTVPLLAMVGILNGFDGKVEIGAEAEKLVALFHLQAREGPLERDLLYLLRPGELRQIFSGLLFGGRRHVEISRRMDAALAGEPVGVWKRLAVIGRAVRGLRPGQIGGLLALARAKDAFGRSRR